MYPNKAPQNACFKNGLNLEAQNFLKNVEIHAKSHEIYNFDTSIFKIFGPSARYSRENSAEMSGGPNSRKSDNYIIISQAPSQIAEKIIPEKMAS